jgi:hypothetical protein
MPTTNMKCIMLFREVIAVYCKSNDTCKYTVIIVQSLMLKQAMHYSDVN